MNACLVLSSLLLSCLPKAESPTLHPRCDDGEYPHSGICCLLCPAGTHMDEPCLKPHTRGRCGRCTEGEDYTAHDNSLSRCLDCDECKYGKRTVKPCTVKSNTICQCEDGYYCPLVCEQCIRCTAKCPEEQIVVQKCNATADTKCGTPPAEALDPTIKNILIVFGVISFGILLIIIFLKRCRTCKSQEDVKDALISISKETLSPKADESAPENWKVQSGLGDPPPHLGREYPENAERISLLMNRANDLSEDPDPGTVPSAPPLPDGPPNGLESNTIYPEVIVKNLSHKELNTLYYDSRHTVPQRDWKMLVRRMGLSDNDIQKITRDNSNNADEQDYQMLKTLQDRLGIEEALYKLLNSLWDLKLMRIYENLRNELISRDIITLKKQNYQE